MPILWSILVVVEIIVCFLLIALILVQRSKGGGLGASMGGGMGESLFGARAGNVLTKATVVLASLFMLNTMGLAMLSVGREDKTLMDRYIGDAPPVGGPITESPSGVAVPYGETPSGVPAEILEEEPETPEGE